MLVLGTIAGWLAGPVVQGTGFGLVGDILGAIFRAFIGAVILLVIVKIVRSIT